MKRIFAFSVTLLLFLGFGCNVRSDQELKLMVVTGGHRYDTTEFAELIHSLPGFSSEIVTQPEANQMIADRKADQYDAIVFYDMWRTIDSATIAGYHHLLELGTGMVFLHHSLVSYQDWSDFIHIIGGKYHRPEKTIDTARHSNYRHDIEIGIEIANEDHPITRDLKDFTILDEGYGNIEVRDDVTVILKADHPDCAEKVGWVNNYRNSKIVYLMQGHDKHAYQNESFRKLLENAVLFVDSK
jgi:type 1 glutamine amidotransferase